MSTGNSILRTTTPAANRKLVTAATLTAELGLTGSEGVSAATLADRVSAEIESYTVRIFAKQTYQLTVRRVSGETALVLPNPLIVSITSVVVDGVTLGVAEYEYDAATGLLYFLSDDAESDWSGSKIVITFVSGYILPGDVGTRNLPVDIEAAAIRLAQTRLLQSSSEAGVRSVNLEGEGSVSYVDSVVTQSATQTMPPDVEATLRRWRIPVLFV